MSQFITSHSRIIKLCLASILALVALVIFFWLAAQADETPNSPLATPPPDAFIGRNGSICLYNNFASAMNAASSGDKLFIKQGTHLKTIGTITKTLTFAAASPNCTTPSSTRVTLDANHLSRMATINPSTTVTFTNLILTHGSDNNGGMLYMYDYAKVVLKHTDLYLSSASVSGGAVYMLQGGTLVIQNDSWLNANSATGISLGGGAIYAYSSTITISDTSKIGYFNGNITDGSGGGIYLDGGTLNMYQNSAILSNLADNNGGGVYACNGARIYLHDDTHIGWTTTHFGNQALDGGGLYLEDSGTGLLMYDDSSIENNAADHYGGGIYLGWGSWANLGSASVISNTALTQGGGILIDDYAQLVIGNDNIIQDNWTSDPSVANSYGGGISIPGDDSMVSILDSAVFSNTSSGYGGGIAMLGDSTLSLNSGTELAYNIAQTHDGGGIAITQGALTVTGSLIHDNETARNGGGIYQSGGTMSLVDANIHSNQAAWSGGGLLQQAGEAYLEASSTEAWIADNMAGINGGGIYSSGYVSLTIAAKTSAAYHIDGNTAGETGGGIYAAGGLDLLSV